MTENMWAMFDPTGKIVDDTVQRTRKQSIYNGAVWGKARGNPTWRTLKKRGYRVVKVSVVPLSELDNDGEPER